MTSIQPRKPAGTPVGGEFANKTGSAPTSTLSRPPITGNPNDTIEGRFRAMEDQPLEERSTGMWSVASETPRWDTDFGYRAEMSMGGGSFQTGRLDIATELYRSSHPEVTREELAAMAAGEEKVTVLVRTGGQVEAWEGTVMWGNREDPVLKQKLSRTKAYKLTDPVEVLAVRKGMGKAPELAQGFHDALRQAPELTKPTFDGLPASSEDRPSAISAAYVIHGPRFDRNDPVPRACMFFATDYDAEYDIVNGYFYANPGSGLVSEHGSILGADIKRSRAGGQIAGFDASKGVTFAEVMGRDSDTLEEMAAWLSEVSA